MKKKRKKANTLVLNWLQKIGSAPDVPKRAHSIAVYFAVQLFGDKECLDDVVIKTFEIDVSENNTVKWDTVICDRQLFVYVPNVLGSKESFIALLEIAEEELECEHVICCIPKEVSEKSTLIRTFKYMGFEAFHQQNNSVLPFACQSCDKFIFLGYEL